MRSPKYFKAINKVTAALATAGLATYASLCGYFSHEASKLPNPNTDKLAIMITKPVHWFDYLRYFPGATDLYVHRVETAFGKHAIVYDPVKNGDVVEVLEDTSISDVVIAGHGSWDQWSAPGARIIAHPHNLLFGHDKDGIPKKIDYPPKEGLFVRHTCGIGRQTLTYPEISLGTIWPYQWEMQTAVPEVVRMIIGTPEHRSKGKVFIIIREGTIVEDADSVKIDAIMEKYYRDVIANAAITVEGNKQLGTEVMTKKENVRGWDYVTTPLLFLWDPIPRHMSDEEIIAGYTEEILPQIIASKPYKVVSELEYQLGWEEMYGAQQKASPTKIARIQRAFWENQGYIAGHREMEDALEQCIDILHNYPSGEFLPKMDRACRAKKSEVYWQYNALQICVDEDDINEHDTHEQDTIPTACKKGSTFLHGDEEIFSLLEWLTLESQREYDEMTGNVCLPETSIFRNE
ncbi:hypothetical protein HZC31_02705 [Candidatus Woesearchaeota archaeon]|nr:hypothetical protein [Candidatus Woesearchaeota archaeon]